MITLPIVLFGLVVALLIGALYHAARGGDGWRLLLYFFLSIIGFTAGQWLSMTRGLFLFAFGALDLGMGAIGSILCVAIGDWLSRAKPAGKSGV